MSRPDCRRHHASHAHVHVCLIFSVVFWTYDVYMIWLFFLNVDINHCWGNFILKTRFYSTLQFRETIFSALCDVYKKPVKPFFWSTNTVRYLHSFWVLVVLYWVKLNNNNDINLLAALVDEKKKEEGFLEYNFKTAKCMKEIICKAGAISVCIW